MGGQGAMLATCSDDTSIRIWTVPTGEMVMALRQHADEVFCAWKTLNTIYLPLSLSLRTVAVSQLYEDPMAL